MFFNIQLLLILVKFTTNLPQINPRYMQPIPNTLPPTFWYKSSIKVCVWWNAYLITIFCTAGSDTIRPARFLENDEYTNLARFEILISPKILLEGLLCHPCQDTWAEARGKIYTVNIYIVRSGWKRTSSTHRGKNTHTHKPPFTHSYYHSWSKGRQKPLKKAWSNLLHVVCCLNYFFLAKTHHCGLLLNSPVSSQL